MISLFAAVSILGVSSFCFEFLPMLWWKSKFQSARSVMRLFSVREFAKPFSRPFESCSRNICYIYSLYKIQNQTTPSSQIVPKQHWRTNQPIEPSVVRPATFNHVQTQSQYPLWSYPTNHRMRTLPWTRPVIWSATAVGEAAEIILIPCRPCRHKQARMGGLFKVLEKAPIAGDE